MSRVQSVWAWGPSTSPTPCALAGRRCSLWGWRKGVPGGGAIHHCEGRLRSRAVPPLTAGPLGGLLGSASHVLWVRVCGCGGPTLSPWPACPVGAACPGGAGGPSPGGGVACHQCEGLLVSGAVPPLAARPLERAARVLRPVRPWCGRCGPGDPAPAPRRAPFWAGVARRGGGGRASPGGLPSAVVRGRLGSDADPPPAARPLGGLPWLAGHVLWARVLLCAMCVVSVRCVSWCAVSLFSCPSGAPLSGASVRCCACLVPAVPPSLRASLARLLATSCFFRGFVALYPFLYPSPWHALFTCLRSGACLGLFPCRLVLLSSWDL